jgi:hypothetical protein
MIASKGVNLTRKSSWKLLEDKKVEKQKKGYIVAKMIVQGELRTIFATSGDRPLIDYVPTTVSACER